MFMQDVKKHCNLTKKAIEYYIAQGLVQPTALENGYRVFSDIDIERLEKIAVYRKIGLSVEEIEQVLTDSTGMTLKKIAVKRELALENQRLKKQLIEELVKGVPLSQIQGQLNAIEQGTTITERLMEAFPGYFGRFICLHFARFLNHAIDTPEQQEAYEEILAFLDNTPTWELPKELQDYLEETSNQMSVVDIQKGLEHIKKSIENPEQFIADQKEILEAYIAYKESEEYLNSPFYRIQNLLKEFNSTYGYYDIFLPAMKRLSPSYLEYYHQSEIANEKLLKAFPQLEKWQK